MNSNLSKLITCSALAVGVGVWGGMARKLDSQEKFNYQPNVACIKGSPYGKILALAMQGPIDFYWHKGKTHEDEEILGGHDHDHDHGGSCGGCSGCGGHGDCDADPDHQADHDHVHDSELVNQHHDHDEDHHHHHHGIETEVKEHDESLRMAAKHQIKKMTAASHRKTDGKPLTKAHEKYLQSVTEDKLRLAYELDPSNYTNYGNYHLFIATTTFGKSAADDDAAVALARRTLDYCKQDQVDPSSWVTAASAAYNIIFHIGRYHQHFTVSEAKASLAEFDFCLENYMRLKREALESGRIVSETRMMEMEERVRYLRQLRKAQGVYMKRVMSTKMAHTKSCQPVH